MRFFRRKLHNGNEKKKKDGPDRILPIFLFAALHTEDVPVVRPLI